MSKKENPGCLVALLQLAALGSWMLFAVIARGWLLAKAWLWFISPLGVPAISFFHALGISALIGYLRGFRVDEETVAWVKKQLGITRELTTWETVAFGFAWTILSVVFNYFLLSFYHNHI